MAQRELDGFRIVRPRPRRIFRYSEAFFDSCCCSPGTCPCSKDGHTSYGSTMLLTISGVNLPVSCSTTTQLFTFDGCAGGHLGSAEFSQVVGWGMSGVNTLNTGLTVCLHKVSGCSPCTWVALMPSYGNVFTRGGVTVSGPPASSLSCYAAQGCDAFGMAFVVRSFWDATNGGQVDLQIYFYNTSNNPNPCVPAINYCPAPYVGWVSMIPCLPMVSSFGGVTAPYIIASCMREPLSCGGSVTLTNNSAVWYDKIAVSDYTLCGGSCNASYSGSHNFGGSFTIADSSC